MSLAKFSPQKFPRITYCLVTSVLLFLLPLAWYSVKYEKWNSKILLPSPEKRYSVKYETWNSKILLPSPEKRSNDLCWGIKQDVHLGRMLYERPDVLKPKRSDVMTVTPWLAPIVWTGIYNTDIINAQHHKRGTRIGLTVFAIRKYIQYIGPFLKTAEKFFMLGHHVNYYVLTDQPSKVPNVTLGQKRQLFVLEAPSYKRWQDITMRRMQIIRDYVHDRFINEVDYLVCGDVDMIFGDHVGAEILSDVFGTLHPSYYILTRRQFTHERRPTSAGYIPEDEGDYYYTGCFFGGNIEEVYKLTNYCHHAMLADKEKNIEALWHDESYLNRYFLYYKPTKVLSPEYAWNSVNGNPRDIQKKRFVVVQKDYALVRDSPL